MLNVCDFHSTGLRLFINYRHRFKGFLQVYQLQTENDEEETWRDLVCRISFLSNKLRSDREYILVQAWI